ncbi:unnamed protein product, partial [Mesorhabditis belari]|uniref:PGG domain-containing protein n=1 Tax=Mesorhabditis belari TaxID=2138241 RepID=A0AAF3E8W7_9BILA
MTRWLRFIGFSVIGRIVGGRVKRERNETLRQLKLQRCAFLNSNNENVEVKRDGNGEEAEKDAWRALSHVVDRFCFAAILTITASTAIGLLILAPQFSIRSFESEK